MLALCSMLYPTNYTKNYAGIMGAGLHITVKIFNFVAIVTVNGRETGTRDDPFKINVIEAEGTLTLCFMFESPGNFTAVNITSFDGTASKSICKQSLCD